MEMIDRKGNQTSSEVTFLPCLLESIHIILSA